MMLFFVAFFDSIGRMFDYFLPDRNSIASVIISVCMMVIVIIVFTAQDGKLRELSISTHEQTSTSAGAAYMVVRGGVKN